MTNLLRVVRDAPPASVLKVEHLLELLQPDRDGPRDEEALIRFLLRVAEYSPAGWTLALDAVTELGCTSCSHPRHGAGDCLVGGINEAGQSTYCLCGAPGAGPVVEPFTDEVAQVQRELADRAWEHHQDAQRDAAAEAGR